MERADLMPEDISGKGSPNSDLEEAGVGDMEAFHASSCCDTLCASLAARRYFPPHRRRKYPQMTD